jgi:hypothetical protein
VSPDHPSPFEEPLRDPLPGVKKQLWDEYEDLPEELIEGVAKQALDELASVRVKEFVPIIAWRRARKELRRAS